MFFYTQHRCSKKAQQTTPQKHPEIILESLQRHQVKEEKVEKIQ